jgi:hypothetical protein
MLLSFSPGLRRPSCGDQSRRKGGMGVAQAKTSGTGWIPLAARSSEPGDTYEAPGP